MTTRPATADFMAEGLSKLLGCEIRVLRERRPPDSYQMRMGSQNPIAYWISVRKGEYSFRFRAGRHIGEATRSLAMISDMIQMGFIKVEDGQ